VLEKPREIVQQLAQFLEIDFDIKAMTQQIDESLYRNRGK
jgi:hypothetical protein